ncbi:MAG: flagellar basal body P-ring formation chaperone FlgA [Candidatus Saganbacteria bacterium]|nr:flagellar basal body P-ring formation chaperone FlgA [Candidatus Saganbacteria bacterium]
MRPRSVIFILLLLFISGIPAYSMSSKKIEAGIVAAVEDYIYKNLKDWKDADIRVTFKYASDTFSMLEAKKIDLTFKIVPAYFNYKPVWNIILPVDVSSSEGKVSRVFLRAKVEILKSVVIANKLIKKGVILEKIDLSTQKRDISSLQSYFTGYKDLLGKEATTAVPSQSVIQQPMVREKPVIARYNKVMVVIRIENLSVKAPGRAMEDGYIGKTIKVQNTVTKKYFVGTVVSSNEVKVEVE